MSHISIKKSQLAMFLALLATLCATLLVDRSVEAAPPTLTLEPIITSGLSNPVDITGSGIPGDNRLFVVERFGRVRIIDANGILLTTPFLDLSAHVNQGILGITFDPDYAENGYFYVFYNYLEANQTPVSRVSRFQRSDADPDLAEPTSETVIISYEQPIFDHSGGALHFGPDGYLYVATGDGGSGSEQAFNGQNREVLLGKMLRLDVHAGGGTPPDCDPNGAYFIPPDNPFGDGSGGACDELWAIGLRNPWRFSFDRLTGEMWIADVGQDQREEIDFEPAGFNGGRNYGWTCYEGSQTYILTDCGPADNYDFPLYEYDHSLGCSITGGVAYRGDLHPAYAGHYFFADFCSANFWSLYQNGTAISVASWDVDSPLTLANPVSIGENNAGELLLVDLNGRIFRMRMAGTPTAIHLVISATTADRVNSVIISSLLALAVLTTVIQLGNRNKPGAK